MADERARALRQKLTDAERVLWSSLRLLRARGLHFRRQAPFGRYVVDFACHGAKIIVELDGSQHAQPQTAQYDAERTEFLRRFGYRVLRFWNLEVLRNLNGVVEAILAAARRPPHPKRAKGALRPPHKGEVRRKFRRNLDRDRQDVQMPRQSDGLFLQFLTVSSHGSFKVARQSPGAGIATGGRA